MKKIILAMYTGRNADDDVYYWEYNNETNNWWVSDESQYAIVKSKYGYQLVEVIGRAKVRNDFEAEKSVVTFLTNDMFPKGDDKNE